jgi:hypothetical protein
VTIDSSVLKPCLKWKRKGIFNPSQHSATEIYLWRDLAASYRSLLKIFRHELNVKAQLSGEYQALQLLGQLDAWFRQLDLFYAICIDRA